MKPFIRKSQTLTVVLLSALASQARAASDQLTIRYTKETLAKESHKDFIRQTDLADVLSSKLKGLAIAVTARQSGSNVATRDLVASGKELPKMLWLKKISTLAVDPDQLSPRSDEDRLRTNLAAQYRKSVEVQFKNSFPVIERLQRGLNFNLDLTNPSASLRRSNQTPKIRYGLVEADIVPVNGAVPVASSQTFSEMDHEYATPAKVIYTIDRIEGEGRRAVFAQEPVNNDGQLPSTSIWKKRPSSSIKVKIDAADQNTAFSDQLGQGQSLPGMRLTLAQADGLITTHVIAGGAASRKTLATEMKAPIYGEMSVGRKFDYRMQPTETSAQNILGDSDLARVNLLYAHTSNKLRGEWIVKRERFEYNVIAEPRQGWGKGAANQLGKVGDKISFGMNTNF
jgi:hypothetical protein